MEKIELKEKQINAMVFGISNINMFFAKMEEHLINEHKREIKYDIQPKKKVVKILESKILNKLDSTIKNNLNLDTEIKKQ